MITHTRVRLENSQIVRPESMVSDVNSGGFGEAVREGSRQVVLEPEGAFAHQSLLQPTVLIIEDTVELAEVISATLERQGFRTVHETHVDRGLEAFRTEHPEVILLDIGLPDKSGWKLLDGLKNQNENASPAIVVITAHGDPANRLMGKLQGVFSYLIKPFTPGEIVEVVGRAIATATGRRGVATGVNGGAPHRHAEQDSVNHGDTDIHAGERKSSQL